MNVWKSRVGAQGTYRALMEVFVRANKRDYAEVIVNILSEGAEVTTGSDSSGGKQLAKLIPTWLLFKTKIL